MTRQEEILTGGGVNEVVRIGATVRRPVGPWTPAVHGLLGHLAARGFTGAPRAHGVDERGRDAHPAPRLWDVAYAAYRFVPLSSAVGGGELDGNGEAALPVAEQARRLRLLCDAYGLAAQDRRVLPEAVVERLHALVAFMRERAAAGSAAFAGHLADGHHELYLRDARHVAAHARQLRPE
ncbi:hypothetical protein [Nonomuraea glycinis]|uniref:hypothetical protein n=1 Tax=Nonomuraea glycinis TaxID=2047744 RepID=UPI0033AB493F